MRVRQIEVLALALVAILAVAVPCGAAGPQPSPGPFVTVYHDDEVSFQVRRDRITPLGDGVHKVWLRWLWATPQPWKSSAETSRITVADVDCTRIRIRELAVLHRDATGKVFDVEEHPSPETLPWRPFEPGTGAAAAIGRLCEFLPQLLQALPPANPEKP